MTEKTGWKRRILVAALDGSVPVKELQGSFEEPGHEQSDSDHRRDAEEKAEREAEVKALERENAALAKKVSRLEEATTPLPEFMVGVDVEGGDVGGNVPRTREPPARKGEVPAPQGYRVKITGDTVGGERHG